MILAEELNTPQNYIDLGFDKQLNREVISDEFYTGVNRTSDYKTSLEMDSSVEGFDVGKLLQNQLKQSIKLGGLTIDGVTNRIVVNDGRTDRIIIGALK